MSTQTLEALDREQQRRAYSNLWLELTIAARVVWSDTLLTPQQQLDGLKWINEIQHRVHNAYATGSVLQPEHLLRQIEHHVRQAEHIRPWVGLAIQRAVARAEKQVS